MTDKLTEAIERVRRLVSVWHVFKNEDEQRDVLAVCDAAARLAEVEHELALTNLDRDLHKEAHLEARRERDKLRSLVGEEWDAVAADKVLTNIEQVERERDEARAIAHRAQEDALELRHAPPSTASSGC